jgi:pilus assembly protein CpaB
MTGVSKILAALLLVTGIVLAGLAYYLASKPAAPVVPAPVAAAPAQQVPEQPAVPAANYDVVLAAADILAGTRIDAGMLKVDQWPVALTQGYAKPEALIGEVARLDIVAGEPVTKQVLAQGLSKQLRSGERAVAVPVDEVSGAGNNITPGDLVDVFFALRKGDEVDATQVRLLQSRIRVLAYGAQSVDGPAVVHDKSTPHRAASAQARSALLAVPVADVNELVLASKSGQLQLALRSPEDEVVPDRGLFAPRQAVMPAQASLTREQREALELGPNRAYAGDSLAQLDKPTTQPVKRATSSSGNVGARTIEVVRGDNAQHVPY